MLESIIGRAQRLLVRQSKEWGEILVGFETRNRYRIQDEAGGALGYAAEERKGVGAALLRNFVGRMRALKLHVYDTGGQVVAEGQKPFRFFFHRMAASEGGQPIGAIQRRWSFLNRRFTVEDAGGREVAEIVSPLLRIWTFKVKVGEKEVARISKKWGGLLKEAFTTADTFGIEFLDPSLSLDMRKLLLFATFLVDFTCFEQSK